MVLSGYGFPHAPSREEPVLLKPPPPRKPAPATAEPAEAASPFAMGIPELANLPFALDGFGDV